MKTLNNLLNERIYEYVVTKVDLSEPNKRGWMNGDCPYCGGKMKYGINIVMGKCKCYKCLDYDKSPIYAIKTLEGFTTYYQVLDYLSSFQGVKFKSVDLEALNASVRTQSKFNLPKEFIPLVYARGRLGIKAQEYWISRGFSIKKATMLGIGYCVKGKYAERIIIPYYRDYRVVYFNARAFTKLGDKFKNPGIDESGIGKGMVIYNHDALNTYKYINITESAINSLTIGLTAIGLGGKSISPYQFQQLIKSPTKGFTIILDPDANRESIELALRLVPYKKIRLVRIPEGEDINSLGRDRTLSIKRDTPWHSYQDIIAIKCKETHH